MAKIAPIVFTPSEPISVGEGDNIQTFETLTFARKMKGKDMLAMDAVQGEIRKSFALYASMADVPLAVISELDADDFEDLALKVAPLMGKRGAKVVQARSSSGEVDKTS